MSQFADDSMTPAPIKVSRDKYGNEIPSDSPMHSDNTAGEGAFHWEGNQYDDSPGKSGFGSYGSSVDAGTNKSSTTMVNAGSNKRGEES
jgi:hypothetical protein